MPLVLEVEYLAGVSFSAIGPDSGDPEWPPQPDRIFSALVAAWAARGQDAEEQKALEWLEQLPVPRLIASDAEPRTSAVVFVPPNDPRSDKQKTARGVLPALRSRQPRRFPAARPDEATVRVLWDAEMPKEEILAALQELAKDTAYVGHSASLTRCRFMLDDAAAPPQQVRLAKRQVYMGRFAELRREFEAGRRPLRGAPVHPPAAAPQERHNLFSNRWLLLEHLAGRMPDVRACALIAKAVRDTLLSGYQRLGLGDKVPEVVSGHGVDGGPSRAPHLAIVPLPFAGFPFADGHVMGFALVPPQHSSILDDEVFRRVLRTLAPIDAADGRRVLTITTREGTPSDRAFSIRLSPTFEPPPGKISLEPALYTGSGRTFATVTPIALDRHLKKKGDTLHEELKLQIAAACRHIGLPEPEVISTDKHSAIEGAPSAYPSGNAPAWMKWRVPQFLASRQLLHAVVQFATPVDGPVVLGAGRYLGLGLCRSLASEG